MPLPVRSRRLARVLAIALVAAAALPAGPVAAQPPAPKTWHVAPTGTGGGSCATPRVQRHPGTSRPKALCRLP